ncbi:MAG: hypothetical protein ACK58L_06110 [Planctomycetota bacterium]
MLSGRGLLSRRRKSDRRHGQAGGWHYVLPRLIWLGLGPTLMMTISVLRMESDDLSHDGLDIIYGGILLVTLIIRWMTWLLGDQRDTFGRRTKIYGPISFSALMIFFACGLWAIVTLVAAQNSF